MNYYISVLTKNLKFYKALEFISDVPLKIKYDVNDVEDYNCLGVILDYSSFNNFKLIPGIIKKPIIFISNISENNESYLHFLDMMKLFSSNKSSIDNNLYKLSENIYFSIEKHSVIVKNDIYLLTNLEFRLLYCLFQNKSRPCSVDFLLEKLDLMTPSSLYVCIKKLRQKIEKDCNSPLILMYKKNKGYYINHIMDSV